jgi:hypothetical protein
MNFSTLPKTWIFDMLARDDELEELAVTFDPEL